MSLPGPHCRYGLAFARRTCGSYARATRSKKGRSMWSSFNLAMRIVSSLIGVAMMLMGIVWVLQGLNLAFRVGFMVGDYHWTIYGSILGLVGAAQLLWSNMRQR